MSEQIQRNERLEISRILDLSRSADRQLLRDSAASAPSLLALIDSYLDEYLSLFQEPAWRTIYAGGMVSIPTYPKHSQGFDLRYLLTIIAFLQRLKQYDGFEKLIAGLYNPTQVTATLFEVEVATWCAERAIAVSLIFSPPVSVRGRFKYPDFLWETQLGRLYCECKQGDSHEGKFGSRLRRLSGALDAAYKSHEPWDSSFRLDVSLTAPATNGVERRIANVVACAFAALHVGQFCGLKFEDGEVSAVLRCREEPLSDEPDTIRTGYMTVGTEPTEVAVKNAYFTLTMSVAKHRERATAGLLHEARRQLPLDQPGTVFIRLNGVNAAQKKLLELLAHPAYERTPWVAVWASEIKAVWRIGQPFDDRLLLPRKSVIG
jgi:hypothetical protein